MMRSIEREPAAVRQLKAGTDATCCDTMAGSASIADNVDMMYIHVGMAPTKETQQQDVCVIVMLCCGAH